jgi:PIN domain nuclease of toxin-antitoxin system
VTYLDTNAVLWLIRDPHGSLSTRAQRRLDADDELLISPMVLLELENLFEIRRITMSGEESLHKLGAEIGLQVCSYPFGLVIEQAIHERWTRDPFDRIIVAHARARKAPLVTKDENILRNYKLALW